MINVLHEGFCKSFLFISVILNPMFFYRLCLSIAQSSEHDTIGRSLNGSLFQAFGYHEVIELKKRMKKQN